MYGRTTFALSSRSLALSERLKVKLAVGSGCYGGVCVGVSVACVRVCVCVCVCVCVFNPHSMALSLMW